MFNLRKNIDYKISSLCSVCACMSMTASVWIRLSNPFATSLHPISVWVARHYNAPDIESNRKWLSQILPLGFAAFHCCWSNLVLTILNMSRKKVSIYFTWFPSILLEFPRYKHSRNFHIAAEATLCFDFGVWHFVKRAAIGNEEMAVCFKCNWHWISVLCAMKMWFFHCKHIFV